jgi:anti-sigma-K factor RskA
MAEAVKSKASADLIVAPTSLVRRRIPLTHATKRSTTQRRAWTAKPIWPSSLRTISARIVLACATRSPWLLISPEG